jgi:SAM-dependent methyltransferase
MTEAYSVTTCPICGAEAADLTLWLDIPVDVKSGKPIATGKLVWCSRCEQGMMRRLPTPQELRESYDLSAYYTHGQSHMPEVRPGFVDRVLMKLAYLGDGGRTMDAPTLVSHQPRMRRVLDIGCGGGGFVEALAAEGRELFGIEPDPKAREAASARGITVFDGTAEEIPAAIRGQTFDLIILSHVLEHCLDPRQAIRNVHGLLDREGVFYCEVPNCGALHFQTYAEISEMLDVPRHIFFFTAKSLKALLEAQGFEIRAETHHGYTRHFTAGWRAWENHNHRFLSDHGGGASKTPRRSLMSDLRLLARSAFAKPKRKYDCIGLIAGRRT